MNSELLLLIIKLVLGGIVSFLAIFVMSKTRDSSWMLLVAGFLFSYAALVFDLMIELGIVTSFGPIIFGIPLSTLICVCIPSIFFIASFIVKLLKK